MKEKNRKSVFFILTTVCIVLVLLLIFFYRDIDALVRYYVLKEPVVVLSNNQILENETSGLPKMNIPEVSQLKGVGETCQSDLTKFLEGKREYTLNNVTLYNTIMDSPISVEECTQSPTIMDKLKTYKFLIADMTVKNLNTEKLVPIDEDSPEPFLLDLITRDNMSGISSDSEIRDIGSFLWYFSKHPKLDDPNLTDKYYFGFDLEPEQSMDFQIGIAIPQEAYEKKTTFIQVGYDNENLTGFMLFE